MHKLRAGGGALGHAERPRRQSIRHGVPTGPGAVGMPWATSLWPKQRRMLLSLEMRVQHALWTHPEK